MIDMVRRNPVLAALAVACAVLAAVIVVEVATIGAPASAPAPRKVSPSEAKLLPPVAAVAPEAAYPETASRPLWIPTRRPAPPVVAAAQPAFARGQFILQGVTIAGNTRIAMLKEKSTGRVHRIEQGRDVNGLQVAEVDPDKVTLAQGAEREVVELRVQRPGGAPTGAPGAPTAATPASSGPFASGATAPAAAPGGPGTPVAAPTPVPPGAQTSSSGPMPPRPAATPAAANTPPAAAPQQSTAPMTPEELLARRRARRNLSNE